jgi:hypothetical protein
MNLWFPQTAGNSSPNGRLSASELDNAENIPAQDKTTYLNISKAALLAY